MATHWYFSGVTRGDNISNAFTVNGTNGNALTANRPINHNRMIGG